MAAPERTSVAEIVTAGRVLLELGGPSGLTMQAVAQRVGVRAPSLYKRVRDREALMALVAAQVVDDLWQRLESSDGTIAGLGRACRTFAHDHPEGFRLILTAEVEVESLARASAPVLRTVTQVVGEGDAREAARFVTAWVTGFITMELAGAFRLGGDIEQAFDYGLERLADSLAPAV